MKKNYEICLQSNRNIKTNVLKSTNLDKSNLIASTSHLNSVQMGLPHKKTKTQIILANLANNA